MASPEEKTNYSQESYRLTESTSVEGEILKANRRLRQLSSARNWSKRFARRRGIAGIVPLSFSGAVLSNMVFPDSKALGVAALVTGVVGATGVAGAIEKFQEAKKLKQEEGNCFKEIKLLRKARNSQNIFPITPQGR